MHKKLNFVNTFITIVVCSFTLINPFEKKDNNFSNENYFEQKVTGPCRADVEWARKNLEIFLTHEEWEPERQETGADGLTISQIQILDSTLDANACQYLNNRYNETIEKRSQPENDPVYDVAYYKAGNFYFVSIILAQPSNSNVVSTGLSFIIIFDQNLNRLEGYSF
jgi:hypothetical protein